MTTTDGSPRATGGGMSDERRRGTLSLAGAIAAAFMPVVVTGLVPDGNTLVASLACLCGVQATVLGGGARRGGAITAAAVVSIFAATLVAAEPPLAAAWMAVVALGAGIAAARGLMPAYAAVGIATGFVVMSPEPVATALKVSVAHPAAADLGRALENALVAAVAGGWAVAVAARGLPRRQSPLRPLDRRSAALLAVALAVAGGGATLVVLEWYPVPLAAWLILTLYVVAMSPDPAAPSRTVLARAAQRALGTLAGATVAVALARAIPETAVLHLLGLVLIAIAAYVAVDRERPYWISVLFLTPAVVFFDSDAGTAVRAGELRAAFTVAGVLVAAGVVVAMTVLVRAAERLGARRAG